MSEYLGNKVKVVLKPSGKRHLKCNDDTLTGEILPKVDWLVGCPVFSCDKGKIGLHYDCEVIEVIK